MSDGMFLSACRHVSKDFPDISYDEDLLDRVCLQVCCFVSCQIDDSRMTPRTDRTKSPAVFEPRYGDAQPLW